MTTARVKQTDELEEALATGELPEGWELPTLGSFLTVNYGKGLKGSLRKLGRFSVFGSNGIVGQHNEPLTSGPTIVIGRKGTVGALHFSPQPCWPIDTTYFIDEFHGLDQLYLTHGLSTLNLRERDTSTAIPGLNRDDLYAQQMPLAPLAEQRRIVAKVEELLAQINKVRSRLERVSKLLKAFRQSVLAAAAPAASPRTGGYRSPTLNRPLREFKSSRIGLIEPKLGVASPRTCPCPT